MRGAAALQQQPGKRPKRRRACTAIGRGRPLRGRGPPPACAAWPSAPALERRCPTLSRWGRQVGPSGGVASQRRANARGLPPRGLAKRPWQTRGTSSTSCPLPAVASMAWSPGRRTARKTRCATAVSRVLPSSSSRTPSSDSASAEASAAALPSMAAALRGRQLPDGGRLRRQASASRCKPEDCAQPPRAAAVRPHPAARARSRRPNREPAATGPMPGPRVHRGSRRRRRQAPGQPGTRSQAGRRAGGGRPPVGANLASLARGVRGGGEQRPQSGLESQLR